MPRKKKGDNWYIMGWTIIGIIIIILVLGVAFFLISNYFSSYSENYPNEQKSNDRFSDAVNDSFSNVVEPHWDHMPLTYEIINIEDCSNSYDIYELYKAMDSIESSTKNLISFVEFRGGDADIQFICVPRREFEEGFNCEKVLFDSEITDFDPFSNGNISGINHKLINISRYYSITQNRTQYDFCYLTYKDHPYDYLFKERTLSVSMPKIEDNIIVNGTVYLYEWDKKCIYYPSREVNALLQLLAFDFSVKKSVIDNARTVKEKNEYLRDIMAPYIDCNLQREINRKYLDCLSYIYTNGDRGLSCNGVNFIE